MPDDILWHNEEPIRALGIKVPAWADAESASSEELEAADDVLRCLEEES